MLQKTKPQKYLRYLVPTALFGTRRTRQILTSNPITLQRRTEPDKITVCVYDYNQDEYVEKQLKTVEESFAYKDNKHVTWINVDGIRKDDIEIIGNHFGI